VWFPISKSGLRASSTSAGCSCSAQPPPTKMVAATCMASNSAVMRGSGDAAMLSGYCGNSDRLDDAAFE
jgi:hypothetical protein